MPIMIGIHTRSENTQFLLLVTKKTQANALATGKRTNYRLAHNPIIFGVCIWSQLFGAYWQSTEVTEPEVKQARKAKGRPMG